jgi:hypothetical protein
MTVPSGGNMPGYWVLVCSRRSLSVVRGPYSNGWPGGADFGAGVTRRWGCDGGRNRSGFSSTRGFEGLGVWGFLAFLNAALVEVKLRAFWRWSARSIVADGGPLGRRKPGIGVGMAGGVCC